MAVITTGGSKGGTGKSTTITNLIVIDAKEGKDDLLIDANKDTESSSIWAEIRRDNKHKPSFPCIRKHDEKIDEFIDQMKPKYDNIFIDCGGYDDGAFRSALLVTDIFLMPVQASSFDLWTIAKVDNIVRQAKRPNPNIKAYILINLAPTHPLKKDAINAINFIKEGNFEHLSIIENIIIGNRDIFKNIVKYGLSVVEYKLQTDSDKHAFGEITDLYKHILGA